MRTLPKGTTRIESSIVKRTKAASAATSSSGQDLSFGVGPNDNKELLLDIGGNEKRRTFDEVLPTGAIEPDKSLDDKHRTGLNNSYEMYTRSGPQQQQQKHSPKTFGFIDDTDDVDGSHWSVAASVGLPSGIKQEKEDRMFGKNTSSIRAVGMEARCTCSCKSVPNLCHQDEDLSLTSSNKDCCFEPSNRHGDDGNDDYVCDHDGNSGQSSSSIAAVCCRRCKQMEQCPWCRTRKSHSIGGERIEHLPFNASLNRDNEGNNKNSNNSFSNARDNTGTKGADDDQMLFVEGASGAIGSLSQNRRGADDADDKRLRTTMVSQVGVSSSSVGRTARRTTADCCCICCCGSPIPLVSANKVTGSSISASMKAEFRVRQKGNRGASSFVTTMDDRRDKSSSRKSSKSEFV